MEDTNSDEKAEPTLVSSARFYGILSQEIKDGGNLNSLS